MPVCSSACCARIPGTRMFPRPRRKRRKRKTFLLCMLALLALVEFVMTVFLLSLRGEKEAVRVRSVDCGVTQRAGLVFLRLIVESRSGRWSCIRVQRMATHAQEIHLVLLQHPRVGGAVGRMAHLAALDLGFMLVNERPLLVGVALVTNFVLASHGAKLVPLKPPMRIVAVVALHESFIHAVVKGARELRPHVHVAAVAQLRRRFLQQKLGLFRMMWRMAIDAGHAALQVGRARVVALFVAALVAGQAASADLFGRGALECEDFRFVASPIHVGFTWAVAAFASVPLGPFLIVHCGDEVW